MTSGIACVVFDFDGVLVASNAVKRQAYFDVFADVADAAPVVAAVLAGTAGDRYDVIGAVLASLQRAGRLDSDGGRDAVERYAEAYNRICEEFTATCIERPGVSALLADLARVYPLYVNSATPEVPLRRVVRRRGWDRYFRDVLGRPATKAENLARVVARERLAARHVVFVGDRRTDLDAARAVGCAFVGVRSDECDLAPTDGVAVVAEPSQLAELVLGAAASGSRPC